MYAALSLYVKFQVAMLEANLGSWELINDPQDFIDVRK